MFRSSFLFCFLLVGSLASSGSAKTITIRGYVTAVRSPTSFEVDDYKVTDETAAYAKEKDQHVRTLKPGVLRVGLEVEVKGEYDRNTRELKAQQIEALSDDANIESTGLVEKKLSLTKNEHGWSGTLLADGETLLITPETEITVRRTRPERKELKQVGASAADGAFSPADVDLDMFARYEGTRQDDHSIRTTKVEFQQDRVADEYHYTWTTTQAPHVVYPDHNSEAGVLTVDEKTYALFPSPEASVYLTRLGESLIPVHQRELPGSSPAKVRFRFYLIDTDTVAAGSYPNGVVVVSAHVFDVLENEAQLAFMLSHDIARAVEKQDWAVLQFHRKERMAIGLAGVASGFAPGTVVVGALAERRIVQQSARVLEGQADRIGLQYMLAAGYDPRQAPETWRVIADKHADEGGHLFWANHDQNLVRRSYLESELMIHFPGQDFSALKKDSTDFHAAVDAIKAARERAKQKKK